jgi:hypothetical protein
MNLFWWFLNDFEPRPPDWYRPGKQLRTLFWYLRNPFQNAGRYVLGVADRTYTVTGEWPVTATVWEDVRWSDFPHLMPRHGWKRATLKLENGRTLPWISYSTPRCLAYCGWQPNGFAGVKFNRLAYLSSPLLPLAFVVLVLVRMWFADANYCSGDRPRTRAAPLALHDVDHHNTARQSRGNRNHAP